VDRPLAWITAGDGEVAAGRLLDYLGAAISEHVSGVEGLARSALAASISHDDVAAMLVEAVGDQRLLLVIDELERVVQSAQAVAVLCAWCGTCPKSSGSS
jgi:hypothetical protein